MAMQNFHSGKTARVCLYNHMKRLFFLTQNHSPEPLQHFFGMNILSTQLVFHMNNLK